MKRFISSIICIALILIFLTISSLAAKKSSSFAVIRTAPNTVSSFRDVPTTAWYYNDVMEIVNAGIMKGKEYTIFDPDGKITNAEIAQILKNLQVPAASDKCRDFVDVPNSTWYTENAISYGVYFPLHYDRYRDVVEFWPDYPIIRCDLAYTLLQGFGYDEDYIDTSYMEITGERIIGWRRYPDAALLILAHKGVISGYPDGTLGETDTVSRAQCATILNRFIAADQDGRI